MAIAYLVTDGDYSDYRVRGVFLDKEQAERAKILWAADNEVEEYEIGAMPEWSHDWTPWFVTMHTNGDYAVARPSNTLYFKEDDARLNELKECNYGDDKRISIYVAAKTPEQAIKVANEKRIQWLASR